MPIGERILLALSRKPGTPEYANGTLSATTHNALDFVLKTVPGFLDIIKGAKVLDFGCGWGNQSVAMRQRGAMTVDGVDIIDAYLERGRELSEAAGVADSVHFHRAADWPLPTGEYDVVLSCSSFEHFDDPALRLRQMASAAKQGGLVVLTWAEPFYSPYGAHCSHFTRMPWIPLLFSERTVYTVRSHFTPDGNTNYIGAGLNKMTVGRFERIIRESGLEIAGGPWLWATKRLPLVTHIPVVRELLTSACSCVLRVP